MNCIATLFGIVAISATASAAIGFPNGGDGQCQVNILSSLFFTSCSFSAMWSEFGESRLLCTQCTGTSTGCSSTQYCVNFNNQGPNSMGKDPCENRGKNYRACKRVVLTLGCVELPFSPFEIQAT